MEKYLIILVIIFVLYHAYTCWTANKVEGFADAQTVDGVDESNSINTLAKIAKDLQEGGGLKVAGNLYTEGDFSHIGPNKKNKVSLHTPADGRRALFIAPQKIDGTGWEWENCLALDFSLKSFSTNSNNLNVGGDLNTRGNLTIGKDKIINAPGRLHISGDELLYILNKAGVVIGKEWGGNGNLKVQGNYYAEGDARPIVTKVVTGGLARDIDTGINHEQYPAISMGGFFSNLDLEERDGGSFEFNTYKKDGRWWIHFNPRAQGNWHGGENEKRVRARLNFFHKSMVQDDSPNWWGLHI